MAEEYEEHVRAVKLLERAQESFRGGDYSGTETVLLESVGIDPTIGRSWEILGLIEIGKGDFNSAQANFQMAAGCEGYNEVMEVAQETMDSDEWPGDDSPDSTTASLSLLGDKFLQRRMWDAAAVCFLSLGGRMEPSWRYHSTLGFIYREKGDLEPSLDHYNLASEFEDAPPELQFDRSVALIKLGRLEEAKGLLMSLLDGGFANPALFNNIGAVLEAQERLDEAMDAFDEAIEMDPRYYLALYSKGKCLQKMGRMKEAREYLNRALDIEGRVFDLKDVTSREERLEDGRIHVKEVMGSLPERDED